MGPLPRPNHRQLSYHLARRFSGRRVDPVYQADAINRTTEAVAAARDQNRGEVHATPDEDDASATPRTAADRPVRRRTAEDDRQHAGVVRATDGDTSGTDQLDNTVDPGACRQEPDWLDGGGRS